MADATDKPIYFFPPGHPDIAPFKETFETLEQQGYNNIIITVPPEVVDGMDVGMFQQTITVLQHYPQYIDHLIFAFKFGFEEIAESELFFPEEYWIHNKK